LITLKVEIEREDDGRWLAEVVEIPGVLAYGDTQQAALSRVQALALRVIAERLEHGEAADWSSPCATRIASMPGVWSIGESFQPVGAIAVNARRTAKQSRVAEAPHRGRADLDRLRTLRERQIMKSSPEELANLPEDFWDEAALVMPVAKRPISLRLDEDVLEWFRRLGPRYQTRINAILRAYMTRAVSRGDAPVSGSSQVRHNIPLRRLGARAARPAR
jgi:uncharacterized protein (DUF4415 family)/predicted RNase H-like HicB family nuclease